MTVTGLRTHDYRSKRFGQTAICDAARPITREVFDDEQVTVDGRCADCAYGRWGCRAGAQVRSGRRSAF
ncbi:protein of unknown function [Pseudorhizobium banfieldiae]|uniref:Uncharacterized protein n=1 Tax=Pseudorhizobium banfieldiae TaxID=1125847 RepID=L0NAU0_9HYPH|nr:protein of unknown function [Pseudorhizobium banfieldiae]